MGIAIYKNTILIYNPIAGALKRGDQKLRRAVQVLAGQGFEVQLRPTTGPFTATPIAREAVQDGADLIIAAGGDGTINEIANGMVGSAVPLGILPAGTANVLANELRLSSKMEAAAAALPASTPRRISVGRLNAEGRSRYFLMMAGVGFDAQIVYNLNLDLKRALGKIAYWIAGFRMAAASVAQFETRWNDTSMQGGFALAARVRNYGGDLEIARGACLLGHDFELVVFEGDRAITYVKYLAGVLTRSAHRLRGVTITRTRCAGFYSTPADSCVYVQVDGEYAGRLPAQVEIVENALTLLMPPDCCPQKVG